MFAHISIKSSPESMGIYSKTQKKTDDRYEKYKETI
jgi:hypothetical protein